jgi:hypothetical protein
MGSGAFLVEACRQLGDSLAAAWQQHGALPSIAPDEDPVLHARRLVAQRCLYGVDKNPFAVDLAKLSLWLATLARDHPFTFLDHALRHGDSLAGLTREQIASFHWKPERQIPIVRTLIDGAIEKAEYLRGQIHALAESDDTREKAHLLREADDALADVRLVGDLVIASFFAESTERGRERRREELAREVASWLSGGHNLAKLRAVADQLRVGERSIVPFHWPIEFPEVFAAARGGFDAMVGNPPFAGKNVVAAINAAGFPAWPCTYTNNRMAMRTSLPTSSVARSISLVPVGGSVWWPPTRLRRATPVPPGYAGSAHMAELSTRSAGGFSGPAKPPWS